MREKRACSAVRQQLAARHLPADFDASTAVQLLECDAKCHQIKVRMPIFGILVRAVLHALL